MADIEVQRLLVMLEARLDDYNRQMQTATGRLDQVEKAHGKVSTAAAGAQKSFGGLTSAAAGLAGAFGGLLSIGAVATALRSVVGASIEAERADIKLQAVLKATGYVAGVTAEQIGGYASQMQSLTGVDDDTIKSAAAVLATFKNVREQGFERTMTAALDLSAVFGQDLQGSVTMLGKALEDPITGMTALRRVGVSFSESEKEVIKDLVEHNKLADAQAKILAVVEAQVGGTAKALGQTLGGQINVAKAAFGDLQEQVGFFLTKSLNLGMVANTWAGWFSKWSGAMEGAAKSTDGTATSLRAEEKALRANIAAMEVAVKATKAGDPVRDQLIRQLQDERLKLDLTTKELGEKVEQEKKAKDSGENLTTTTRELTKEEEKAAKQKRADVEATEDLIAANTDLGEAQLDYTRGLADLNERLARGSISQQQYNDAMLSLGVTYAKARGEANNWYQSLIKVEKTTESNAEKAREFREALQWLYNVWGGTQMPTFDTLGDDLGQTVKLAVADGFAEGITDGIFGTLAGHEFEDAWSGIWESLWRQSALQMDSFLKTTFETGDFRKGLEAAGVMKGGKIDWGGALGAAGGMVLGYGVQKSNRWMSAAGGAMSGASIGMGAGPWGAAIGAVIGAIAGYIMGGAGSGGRKDYRVGFGGYGVPMVGMEDVSGPERAELARQFLDKYKTYRAGFSDVMQLLGGSADFRGFQFQTSGSSRDLNSMWKQIVSGELPRAMLAHIQPQMIAGLQGMGIGSGRIGSELQSLQEGSFDTAFAKFKAWLGAIVSLDEAMETMGGGVQSLRDKVNETTRESFLGGFDDFMERARELTEGVEGLFSDEQVANAQELLELGQQQWQATLQYMGQLESWIKGISEGADETRFGWQEQLAREGGNANLGAFWQTELERLQGVIGGAGSGEQISEAWQRFQQIADQLWNLDLGDGDAANFGFRQWVEQLFDQTEALALGGLEGFEEEAAQKAEEQRLQYEAMRDALAGATSGASGTDTAMQQLSETTDELNDGLQETSDAMDTFRQRMEATAAVMERINGTVGVALYLPEPWQGEPNAGQTDLVRIIRRGQTW
ncbi:MAG: phage tail length tape measure family protein [Acidobacteria bacterium]|nr:phage tail length tape measure family protein [Acidobacteriota bacterium]